MEVKISGIHLDYPILGNQGEESVLSDGRYFVIAEFGNKKPRRVFFTLYCDTLLEIEYPFSDTSNYFDEFEEGIIKLAVNGLIKKAIETRNQPKQYVEIVGKKKY